MTDVYRPNHELAVNDMQTLLAVRYDAVIQRLLYPETGNEAFTSTIHRVGNEAEFVDNEDGVNLRDCRYPSPRFNLERTLHTLESRAATLYRDKVIPSTEGAVDLNIVNDTDRRFESFPQLEQLQWLVCFGLIAACNKPRVEDVPGVLRQMAPKDRPKDQAFRRAVRALAHRAIDVSEEEAIKSHYDKLRTQLYNPLQLRVARAKFGHYFQGMVARKVLAALLDPFTTAQHTQDEIDVLLDKIEPPHLPYKPLYNGNVPTITLPWPIFPPGERKARTEMVVSRRLPEKRRGEGQKRVYDETRIKWLAAVAMRWPYGGKFVKVDLHNKTNEKVIDINSRRKKKTGDRSRYRAAVLKGPDGSVFAVIADSTIAFPENAMYIGIAKRLHNEQGQPISWRRVFRESKDRARGYGAHRLRHNDNKVKLTDRTVQQRALDYLREAFETQYKGHELPSLFFRKKPEGSGGDSHKEAS